MASGLADPIHQFNIVKLVPIEIGGYDFSFTNSSLFMFAAVIIGAGFLYLTTSSRGLVPGRMQSISEMTYEFVADMLRDPTGEEGMRFFPFVFTIFVFVLLGNLYGLFPYFFTITSHVIITSALALLVFFTVIISGLMRHGLGFLKLFVPDGVPKALLPVIVVIEFLSFLSRPISHSVRLFANMLGGHIALKVFAGFIMMMAGAGFVGVVGAVLPLAMTVMLMALEALMAFLQAYVFAILTCIYLNDALHPSH